MINYHAELVKNLKTILPTHYEMVITNKTETPCITYLELSNVDTVTGETKGYSRLVYSIKVWSTSIADIQKYAAQIDTTLRPLGFKRVGSKELYDNNSTMIQKDMTYEAQGLEDY